MPKDHRSFFERLTGSVSANDEEKEEIEEEAEEEQEEVRGKEPVIPSFDKSKPMVKGDWLAEEEEEGQLAVDMFQTPDEIIIQAVVAGVKPDEMDVSIAQDMVTIRGHRQKQRESSGEDYFYQELYWGGFSRSIMLSQEVDVEEAEATQKNGVLTIRLPKLDKDRVQKIKVKNE